MTQLDTESRNAISVGVNRGLDVAAGSGSPAAGISNAVGSRASSLAGTIVPAARGADRKAQRSTIVIRARTMRGSRPISLKQECRWSSFSGNPACVAGLATPASSNKSWNAFACCAVAGAGSATGIGGIVFSSGAVAPARLSDWTASSTAKTTSYSPRCLNSRAEACEVTSVTSSPNSLRAKLIADCTDTAKYDLILIPYYPSPLDQAHNAHFWRRLVMRNANPIGDELSALRRKYRTAEET